MRRAESGTQIAVDSLFERLARTTHLFPEERGYIIVES